MNYYDPLESSDPEVWLDLDESERIVRVEKWHSANGDLAEGARVHAIIHVVVENQLAMGDPEIVGVTLRRLTSQGVSRHSAIHAIGSVVASQLFALLKGAVVGPAFDQKEYASSLAKLKARVWR